MTSWVGAGVKAGVIVLVQAINKNSAIGINKYRFMELKFKVISDRGYPPEQGRLQYLGILRILGIFLKLNGIGIPLTISIVNREVQAAFKLRRFLQLLGSAKVETVIGG